MSKVSIKCKICGLEMHDSIKHMKMHNKFPKSKSKTVEPDHTGVWYQSKSGKWSRGCFGKDELNAIKIDGDLFLVSKVEKEIDGEDNILSFLV